MEYSSSESLRLVIGASASGHALHVTVTTADEHSALALAMTFCARSLSARNQVMKSPTEIFSSLEGRAEHSRKVSFRVVEVMFIALKDKSRGERYAVASPNRKLDAVTPPNRSSSW
jgi:hypothetical protein